MKRSYFTFIAILSIVLVSVASAQHGMIGIHAGYWAPKDTKSGMLIGGNWGTSIDESVNLGIGFDFFHKSYSGETKVASETSNGMTSKTYVTQLEYSRTVLPLMAELDVKIPMGRYMGYLIRGGLGYSFLWSNEKNYEKKSDETRSYGGFAWQAAFGIYYEIGYRSTFTLDLFYNNCTVSRDVKKSTVGLPVSERVDLSGLGARIGVLLNLK